MKSYVTDSIFSPIRGSFDVAKVYFFSPILKKKNFATKIYSTKNHIYNQREID